MSNTHLNQPIIPISFFDSIDDSGQKQPFVQAGKFTKAPNPLYVTPEQEGQDFAANADFLFNDIMRWDEIVACMFDFAKDQHATKEEARLFAPTVFGTQLRYNGHGGPYAGYRCKQNATLAAMVTLDADNKDEATRLHIDEASARIRQEGAEALLYTTASNRDGYKFRVILPLAEAVEPDLQQRAVRAVCRMLKVGWKSDASRNNAYTLFYVPGQYKGAVNHIEHIEGSFRTAEEWLALYPEPEPKPQPASRPACERRPLPPNPNGEWDAEVHSGHILEQYRSMRHDRHGALYGWAVSLAMSALNFGHGISEDELYEIIQREHDDNRPTKPYKAQELRRIARESVDIANSRVADDPAYLRKPWVEQELERDCAEVRDRANSCPDDFADDPDGVADYEPDSSPNASPDESATERPQEQSSASAQPRADDPIDIFDVFEPQPVLTEDMLPKAIADYSFDEAERIGVDPAAVAVPCITTAAAAIDDRIKIQHREKNSRFLNSARSWAALVSDPGIGKSPSINSGVGPLIDIEAAWREQDDERFAKWQRETERYEYEKKNARKAGSDFDMHEPEEPHYRRLMLNEITMEALAEILSHKENERGVLLQYHELLGFIGGFDAYKPSGVKKDRAAALELFDGGQRHRDLVRGSVFVPNWGASIIGGVQTDKLIALAPSLSSDGLLQRFFPLVEIHSPHMGIDREPNRCAIEDYHQTIRSLSQLQPSEFHDPVRLSSEAQVYRKRFEDLAYTLSQEHMVTPAYRGHASKLDGMFARLLLIMHLIDCYNHEDHSLIGYPERRRERMKFVSGATAERTYNLVVKCFVPHGLRLYQKCFGQGAETARWVAGYILAHKTDLLTSRDLRRANRLFTGQTGDQELMLATRILCDHGWLTAARTNRFEQPSQWRVKPHVHVMFAERAKLEAQQRADAMAAAVTNMKKLREAIK